MSDLLCYDLFCGYGGWAKGFSDAGYRVIGFDVEPKCAPRYHANGGEFILADVRHLDGHRLKDATIIVASPPCTEFSQMTFLSIARGQRGPRDIAKGMSLVEAAWRLIQEARPRYWCLENVGGSVPHISPMLGSVRANHGAWKLWGNFPGFVAPLQTKSVKGRPGAMRSLERMHLDKRDPRERALIPTPLARALAEACRP